MSQRPSDRTSTGLICKQHLGLFISLLYFYAFISIVRGGL